MKILFIISSLSSGGAERVLSTLANHWNSQNWDINVFVISTEKKFYKLNTNINLYHSKEYFSNSILNYSRQLIDIRHTIKKVKPDVIISFLDLINISTIIASAFLKTPVIISERNNFDTLKGKHWRGLRRLTYPFSNGLVVQSNYDFEQYYYVKNKQIIANPLDGKLILKVSSNDKEPIMIAVGSLSHQKGFDILIKALSNVNMKNWKCLIIGEGKERDKLTQLIKSHNLEEKIKLIGQKKNIFDYFKKASIFILSSRYEGFPNVLNEAMAHGCTSVAFNCKTGPSDMIAHGKNGLIVKAEDIEDLTTKITEVINNKSLRDNILPEAMKNKEKNNLQKIAKEWEQHIMGVTQ